MPMTEEALTTLKDQILADPALILDDDQLMRALLAADRRAAAGRNVVDLRGVLVDRLEERLDRLEDTHREVLAAAYENVAGMNQVHRACLAVLDPEDFASFLRVLTHDVAMILGVEVIRLGLEAPAAPPVVEGEAEAADVFGPRSVIQARETLPEGFQRAEFLLEKGAIDMIVDRRELRDKLAALLTLLQRVPAV